MKNGGLLDALLALQAQDGYLTEAALIDLAAQQGRTLTDIYDTASFYSMLRFSPNAETWDVPVTEGTAGNGEGETRIALRNVGKISPESIEDYIAAGGYTALQKARETDREELISTIEEQSLLRGRGGAALGSGSMLVLDETHNIVDHLLEVARFFRHESCGKCSPCREGTMRIEELLEKLASGKGTQRDIDLIASLSDYMQQTCFCPLGQSATTAFMSALKLFPEDFAAKLNKEA